MVLMAYYQYEGGNCANCHRYLGTIETAGGRYRIYCSPACRQAAYRKRKAKKRNSGMSRNSVERSLDQTLHLMRCRCGRGLWTTYGNTQIGNIRCTLCGSEFE